MVAIIHISNQFLHTIAQQKAYILRNKLPSVATDTLNNFEQFILDSKLMSCRKQKNIWKCRFLILFASNYEVELCPRSL